MKSARSHQIKKCLIHFCIVSVFLVISFERVWAVELTLEVQPKTDDAVIRLQANEIDEIGINEILGGICVEIRLPSQYHQKLSQMTQENIGKKLSITLGTETLVIATIHEPLEHGKFCLDCSSQEEARKKISKFGREPGYHLKFTEQEIEDAKLYTEPAKNIWFGKSVYALLNGDYVKAEEFAKKAIESDPDEPSHYGHLGSLYCLQGKWHLALEQLLKSERAIRPGNESKYPGIYIGLGDIYVKYEDYYNAIKYLKKYLSYNNENLNVHHWLATTYEKADLFEFALQEYLFLQNSDIDYFRSLGEEGVHRLQNKR